MFTEDEANVVLAVLLKRLFDLKADNNEQQNDDLIEVIESATNKLDELIIQQGYSNV